MNDIILPFLFNIQQKFIHIDKLNLEGAGKRNMIVWKRVGVTFRNLEILEGFGAIELFFGN